MKYTGTLDTIELDELQANLPVGTITFNINVDSETTFERGDLLAASSYDSEFKKATAADTGKVYAIVRDTSSESAVIPAFISGGFHIEKINDSEVAEGLRADLHKQNIILANMI